MKHLPLILSLMLAAGCIGLGMYMTKHADSGFWTKFPGNMAIMFGVFQLPPTQRLKSAYINGVGLILLLGLYLSGLPGTQFGISGLWPCVLITFLIAGCAALIIILRRRGERFKFITY